MEDTQHNIQRSSTVEEFLRSLRLEQYTNALSATGAETVEDLLDHLRNEEIEDVVEKLVHKRRIISRIEELRQTLGSNRIVEIVASAVLVEDEPLPKKGHGASLPSVGYARRTTASLSSEVAPQPSVDLFHNDSAAVFVSAPSVALSPQPQQSITLLDELTSNLSPLPQLTSASPGADAEQPLKIYYLVRPDQQPLFEEASVRCYEIKPFNKHPDDTLIAQSLPTKTILVVGATGCGKTTLVDTIANYVFNVGFEMEFRLRLTAHENISNPGTNNQAHSQTQLTTIYKIEHHPSLSIKYNLNIIDTPGFGDTEGLDADAAILAQLTHLFQHHVTDVNAVLFVLNASLPRLEVRQKYIFDTVLSLFGKDLSENIYLMLTFADAGQPQVLSAVRADNMPVVDYRKFNNSATFTHPHLGTPSERMFNRMFWDMGQESMREFFDVALPRLPMKSIMMTRNTLKKRMQLENYLGHLQDNIKLGLSVMSEYNQYIEALQIAERTRTASSNFTVTVQVPKFRKIDFAGQGKYTTTCLTCNYTCHNNCAFANDADKASCCAMTKQQGSERHCGMCPQQCHWTLHSNQPFVIEHYVSQETKTLKEIKEKFMDSDKQCSTLSSVIATASARKNKVEQEVESLMTTARDALVELRNIALRPIQMSMVDYVKLMIKSEQQMQSAGWQQRVEQYEHIVQRYQILYERVMTKEETKNQSADTPVQGLTTQSAPRAETAAGGVWGMIVRGLGSR